VPGDWRKAEYHQNIAQVIFPGLIGLLATHPIGDVIDDPLAHEPDGCGWCSGKSSRHSWLSVHYPTDVV